MVRTCARCGQEVADLARFCSNCGAALTDLATDLTADVTGTMEAPVSTTGPLGTLDSGSMAAVEPGTAMLIVRRGPSEGTSFVLNAERTLVGRADDADVLLDDVTVSRRHAEFSRGEAGWQLRDLGSLNGTYVNRKLIDHAVLSGGDELQIGKYRFVFLAGGQ